MVTLATIYPVLTSFGYKFKSFSVSYSVITMPNVTQEVVAFLQGEPTSEIVAGVSVTHLNAICKYLDVQSYTY